MLTPALVLLTLLSGHTRNNGRAGLSTVGDRGVEVVMELSTLDLPELCQLELPPNLSAEELRERVTTEIEPCARGGVPAWVRLRGDGHDCGIGLTNVDVKGQALTIEASASCPQPVDVLVVDWTMFAGTSLDFTTLLKVRPRDGWFARAPSVHLLSKRSTSITVEVKI
jgi:hypothetical protein